MDTCPTCGSELIDQKCPICDAEEDTSSDTDAEKALFENEAPQE